MNQAVTMNQHVFVPVSDDLIYNHPEEIEGPLIPYFVGMECQNWLSIEINPDETIMLPKKANKKQGRPAGMRLAYSA